MYDSISIIFAGVRAPGVGKQGDDNDNNNNNNNNDNGYIKFNAL